MLCAVEKECSEELREERLHREMLEGEEEGRDREGRRGFHAEPRLERPRMRGMELGKLWTPADRRRRVGLTMPRENWCLSRACSARIRQQNRLNKPIICRIRELYAAINGAINCIYSRVTEHLSFGGRHKVFTCPHVAAPVISLRMLPRSAH